MQNTSDGVRLNYRARQHVRDAASVSIPRSLPLELFGDEYGSKYMPIKTEIKPGRLCSEANAGVELLATSESVPIDIPDFRQPFRFLILQFRI